MIIRNLLRECSRTKGMEVLLEYYGDEVHGKMDVSDWLESTSGLSTYCAKHCPYFCRKCIDIELSHPERDTHGPSITLCWCCANAVPNPKEGRGCAWSLRGECVPGCKRSRTENSWIVHRCPEFVRG